MQAISCLEIYIYHNTFTFTLHLADAFVQSDVQGREQSIYVQQRPSVTINTTLHKKQKNKIEKKKCWNVTAVSASKALVEVPVRKGGAL